MVGVDTNVDIPGIEAVVLRVPYWHEEGKDSEHQNNESNGKEFQEHPPILVADFLAVPTPRATRSSLIAPALRVPIFSRPKPKAARL